MFDFVKSETLKPDDLQPSDPMETSTYGFVNNVIAKRAKAIDDAVCAVIRDIATEQGLDTEIILYEENIVKAIANYTPQKPIEDGYYDLPCVCPSCGMDLSNNKPKYCSDCGQRIDWSDE